MCSARRRSSSARCSGVRSNSASCSAGVRLSHRAMASSTRSVAGSSKSFVRVSLNMDPILPRRVGLHNYPPLWRTVAVSGRGASIASPRSAAARGSTPHRADTEPVPRYALQDGYLSFVTDRLLSHAGGTLPGTVWPGSAPRLGHSLTRSARNSRDGGIVRPRVLAVLPLITSSNLVGCSMGRSPGLAPFRMRSMYRPAWRNMSSKFGP